MTGRQIHILIVDSDNHDLSVTHRGLKECRQKFNILTARDCAEAIHKIGVYHLDLVLTELSLTDCCGLAAAGKIIEAAGNVPVIILTSYALCEFDLEAIRCGAEDFLIKGELDEEYIERSIRFAIERKARSAPRLQSRSQSSKSSV